MPTPSNSTHGDILPSDVPAEIRELYLSSQCPPELVPSANAPHRSLAQDLPDPPQDTPAFPPTSLERTRDNGQPATRRLPDNTGLPHGVHFQEPRRMMDGVTLATGPAEDGNGLRQRPIQRRRNSIDELLTPGNEDGGAVEQLERLRLLEDASGDSHPATMEYLRRRREEVLRSSGGNVHMVPNGLQRRVDAHNEILARRNERPAGWRQSLAQELGGSPGNQRLQVRWPPTQYLPMPNADATGARLYGEQAPLASRSGPTSVDEELLRRAYRALQEPNALEQYRAAPESNERSTRSRRQPSWIGHRTSLSRYDDHNLSSYSRNEPSRDLRQALSDPRTDIDNQRSRLASPRTASLTSLTEPESDSGREQDQDLASSKHLTRQTSASDNTISARSSSHHYPSSLATASNQPDPKRSLGIYIPHYLYPGAVFTGMQLSEQRKYPLTVVLKHIDLAKSFLCGHLTIDNLTDNHPRLETYFEAEIIGSRYRFPTRHPTWGASEKQDMLHWNRFPAWHPLMRSQVEAAQFSKSQNSNAGSATLHSSSTTTTGRTISPREQAAVWEKPVPNWSERDFIFMRWKEYFLVPDHKVTNISGASFEGFYYICFDVREGVFHGIYYHAKSERWQNLQLRYAIQPDRGCRGATELC